MSSGSVAILKPCLVDVIEHVPAGTSTEDDKVNKGIRSQAIGSVDGNTGGFPG